MGEVILDALLLPQIARGEETAVHQCLDRYGDLIWSLARRLLPTSADAEDAVQEIFVDIWQNAERFDQEIASEKTFVVMLARRRLIDRRRKLGRSVQGQPIDEAALERPDRQQVDTVELADEAARANRCMEKLHQDQRMRFRIGNLSRPVAVADFGSRRCAARHRQGESPARADSLARLHERA